MTPTPTWFQEFAERIDEGEPTYRRCDECDAVGLPPRQTCRECGNGELSDAELPEKARVVAATEIGTTIPRFSGEAPYTVLIAEFDVGVRLTGQLRGSESIERGEMVELGVENRDTNDWLVTFTPL